jgi:hypothetical protein
MDTKLRSLFLTLLFLSFIHAVEEYLTHFFNVDPTIQFLSDYLLVSSQQMFIVIQAVWLGLLLVIYLLSVRRKIPYWLLLAAGLIFLAELSHIIPSIITFSYYPGFYTSVAIVAVGTYYSKALLADKH